MRTPRIYQAIDTQPGTEIQLAEHGLKHLTQVLRMREGDAFILFNGTGRAWQARLLTVGKRQASAIIEIELDHQAESPLAIHLGLGISKGDRMDYAIQKAVELGVTTITPLFTRYSMVKLDDKRREKRHQHWQGIIIGACEQCGRNQLPVLNQAMNNHDWLATTEADIKLILDPLASATISDITQAPSSANLYIGPEGGLSDEEITDAKTAGFTGIRLGPRILRTETAVVSAITAAQLVWGDLDKNK